jgi:hypothetical protein
LPPTPEDKELFDDLLDILKLHLFIEAGESKLFYLFPQRKAMVIQEMHKILKGRGNKQIFGIRTWNW